MGAQVRAKFRADDVTGRVRGRSTQPFARAEQAFKWF